MLKSIGMQSYAYIKVFVSYDFDEALDYIPDWVEVVPVQANRDLPYFYNLYCNALKSSVRDGWFFFLDDDDYLIHRHVIANVVNELMNPDRAYIVQFVRNNYAKPSWLLPENKRIESGRVGLPCIWLHNKHKDLGKLDGVNENGDFLWIKEVCDKLEPKFLQHVVVGTDRRSYGKMPESLENDEYTFEENFRFERRKK